MTLVFASTPKRGSIGLDAGSTLDGAISQLGRGGDTRPRWDLLAKLTHSLFEQPLSRERTVQRAAISERVRRLLRLRARIMVDIIGDGVGPFEICASSVTTGVRQTSVAGTPSAKQPY